jgi:hypothetical protein
LEWNKDITGELPAPRDDEPEHLRKDIADELSDHLHCALNRELHSTQDEQQAKQNVLSRFGNVNRIARQLWFDSMKEKIMSQRLTLAMTTLMAVVCVVLCVLIWKIADSNQATNLALMEQSRAMSQNILDKLAALSKPAPAPEPAKSLEWNPLKIRLVKGEAGGPPAEGFKARLEENILNATQRTNVMQISGADGIADFGLVRPGAHNLRITTPWNGNEYRSLFITLRPGEEHTEEIICPAEPLPEADVKISVDWPEDLKDKNLWAICSFDLDKRTVDKGDWKQSPKPSRFPSSSRHLAISPQGEVVTFQRIQKQNMGNIFSNSRVETYLKQLEDGPNTSPIKQRSRSEQRSGSPLSTLKSMLRIQGEVTALGISGEFSPQLTWTGKKATLTSLAVGTLRAEESTVKEIRLMNVRFYPVESRRTSSRGGFGGSRGSRSFSESPEEWPTDERGFVLEPGNINE